MKTVRFFTLGCKVNQYDTQSIRERFVSAGLKEIDNGSKADIYIINTCTVTSAADRKSRRLIHCAHRHNPKARIIVTGCYTALDSDDIAKIPGVTHIIKNQDKDRILELLNEHNEYNGQTSITNGSISYFKGHTRAFLKIQDGCNNFCSYCKVPMVRGASRSKSLNEIVQEATRLVRNGFKEIVLCGICLGSYGKDLQSQTNLIDAIEALEKIEGLLRIRLSSIEAADISEELIGKLAQSERLCRHLHIPMQSGDNEILKKMNRKFSCQDYSKLMKKIKSHIPEVAITTDVLVGFPGEDEFSFQNTLNLIKEMLPLKVHIFPYSPRLGTAAYNFRDKVNPLKIKERILRLKSISGTCALTYKKQFINKDMEVLVEERSQENKTCWEGYTDNYIKIRLKSDKNLKNQLIWARLKKVNQDYLEAVFC